MDNWSKLPRIRRARGYRLYDERGTAYLDLHQAGGHALLGHRAFHLTTALKDAISRGNLSDLPSVYGPRLEKELARRFAAFPHVRLAHSPQEALAGISRVLGRPVGAEEVRDPVLLGKMEGPVSLWRPFAPAAEDGAGGGPPALEAARAPGGVRVLIPVLPFAMAGAPAAACFREPPGEAFAPPRPISPVILAGALRALHDLDRYRPAPWFREDLLQGCRGWIQRGIYVLPDFPPERYEEVFEEFLRQRLLLSPQFESPSLLPAEASAGELERMRRMFEACPGG